MSFEKFKELGYDITEREFLRNANEAGKEYEKAYKKIRTDLKDQYSKLVGNGIKPEDMYNEMLKFNRLTKLERKIAKELTRATGRANRFLQKSLNMAFTNNYYYQMYASNWLAPAYNFVYMRDELAELVSVSTKASWKKITARIEATFGDKANYRAQHATLTELLVKNKNKAIGDVRSAITQNLLKGKGINQITKDVRKIIGQRIYKDGKMTESGLRYNARRIARTEMTRVMNDAAYAESKVLQKQEIPVQKKWLATLDKRTRPVHAQLDGQVQEIDKPFNSSVGEVRHPGQFGIASQDIHCRCTTIGIVNNIPPEIRRGRNPVTGKNEVFSYKDFPEWAEENGLRRNKFGKLVPSKKSS